jgi:hypothetical protein
MPAAYKYLTPDNPERRDLATAVIQEAIKRRSTYQKALDYFEGRHPDMLDMDDPDEVDDNMRVNIIKQAAERTASFLFSSEPKLQIDRSTPDDTEQEKYLTAFLKENNALFKFVLWALRGFLAGHTYLRIHPRRPHDEYPRISVLDPTSVTVFWRADDHGDVVWYQQHFFEGRKLVLRDFVPDYENGRWVIYTYRPQVSESMLDQGNVPTLHGSSPVLHYDTSMLLENFEIAEVDIAYHESAICPLISTPHLPNPNSFYGLTEATDDNLSLQDAVNRLWSIANRIGRENASPVDVITGANIDDIDTGDDIYAIPSPTAKVSRLEMKSDMSPVMNTADKATEALLANMRVVLLKGEPKDLQRVTNAAVRTLFLDMLAKNNILRAAYGKSLIELGKLALAMSGKKWSRVNYDITPIFANPLPTDLTEVANINALGVNGGYMAKRQAAENLDMNWTEQKSWIENEREWNFELAQKYMLEQEETNESAAVDEDENHAGTNPKAGLNTSKPPVT